MITKKINIIFSFFITALLFSTSCPSGPASKERTYVGAEKCKKCHIDIYYGWKSTLHPYKFQRISSDNVAGDFSENNSLEIGGNKTSAYKKNNNYYIETTGPDNKVHSYKIYYIIGGFWKQLYVTEFSNGEPLYRFYWTMH